MNWLQNDFLQIGIKTIGAELCSIIGTQTNLKFMWDANPEIWPNHAPNLFPIVGMLKDETYYFEGQQHHLSKHGFIRNNSNFQIVESSNESIALKLEYNESTLKKYPFRFEYYVVYRLIDNILHITYRVKNTDTKPMYFSVGGHPAFKCPVYPDEAYSDYSIVFDQHETSKTYLLNLKSGLLTNETKPVFDSPTQIQLRYDLFNKDALIFKDLKSKKVTLKSDNHGDILSVHFKEFPFLGIWAKPNADYVCIEPWLGIADSEDSNQELTNKEGIIQLTAGSNFEATYSIEIHKPHLVKENY